MTSIADGSLCIQTSSEAVPATPSWFGEVVLLMAHLRKHSVFNKINEQVRPAFCCKVQARCATRGIYRRDL